MSWKSSASLAASLALAGALALAGTSSATAVSSATALAEPTFGLAKTAAAPTSQLVPGHVDTDTVAGGIDYTTYLPAGFDADAAERYPTLYLLHGRGDTQAAWQQVAPKLDSMIADGQVPPLIVVMPDAPWSGRGSYYVDSLYTGGAANTTPGQAVETAFTTDLVDHIDATYPTVDDRAGRAVGGYSMGGAGALRFATAHQDLFSSALVLSPAVYVPSTPVDSSTREFGAYGRGDALYDEARYQELAYPAALDAFDPALPVHLFIAVGDDEYANPKPEDAIHDLDYEAATLYNRAKRVPGITAEMRTYDGGHDWDVWARGFAEGLTDIGPRLSTTPPTPFTGSQTGSAGDDRASGILTLADGSVVEAITAAGDAWGHSSAGGTDILVQKRSSAGAVQWTTAIASPLNERAYGLVEGEDGSVIVGGYQRVDHAGAQNDDVLAAALSTDGTVLWTTTAGDPAAADRAYAIVGDGAGGAFLAGYTSGRVGDAIPAGDKDALVMHVGRDGAVASTHQFGGAGEDKTLAIARSEDGRLALGGVTTGAMPSTTAHGGTDGWLAGFGNDLAAGPTFVTQIGTDSSDQVSALLARGSSWQAAGFTGGALATTPSAGGNDAFVADVDGAGTVSGMRQYGTPGDDRTAALVAGADGATLLVGHTDGRFQASAGSVDVFALDLAAGGNIRTATQFGSVARDGADEYDEANLFAAAAGADTVQIQGLTYGAVEGVTNAGGGDVFLSTVAFAVLEAPGEPSTPTTPTSPAVPGGPDMGGGTAGNGNGAGVSPANSTASALAFSGTQLGQIAAFALLALGAGAVLALRRHRAHGPLATPVR
ncbi:hypothetical protein ALI44B_01615 [Leifsonia sp. ALI-44-B]|uniref:alpha/beta hydrolase-fold protein n=1 Tax=Leifsonia sp. ALI-44-B TaxID=1933776 RepID=UPI00097C6E3A|nr:alpha/beta hydrolase-fold protein [Leifsonia sp. ALI-44-B]ONI63443.1 hypothetical protein ALI44B_01615 [Leifsonia sp. ALI-44-B]